MATGKKTLCSTCQKATSILTCRGCKKDFCFRHVAEHRQELSKQMDEITANHDQLQQTIADHEAHPDCHPVIKKINEWEQQSIDKIHQTADNARKQLLIMLDKDRTQVANDLAFITTELSSSRNEDDYVDTDLKEWTEKLDGLKIELTAAHKINFGKDNDEISLIPKLSISDASTDIFKQTTGDAQIIEDGRVLVHVPMYENIIAALCKGDYSLGRHRFHFKIEQLFANNGFSCGVVSRNTVISSIFKIPDRNKNRLALGSSASDTYFRLNHNVVFSFHDQNYQFELNDIYELLIDCNQQKMHLTNERTRYTRQLDVNLTMCPFPWRFFITLLYANDRVCLC